jgi:hypothetical protein
MQNFSESGSAKFSDLERQILTSGLSLADISETVAEFRTNGRNYILAMYRDIARKCIVTMIRLRNLTGGACFEIVVSHYLVEKLSRPINKDRRYITSAERAHIIHDLMLLYQFLSYVQKHIARSSPNCKYSLSQVDDLVTKMHKISLLPFVPNDDLGQQNGADVTSGETDTTDLPSVDEVERNFHGFIQDEINLNLITVDTFFFMDYNGKLKTDAADVLRAAGADAWGINAESDGTFMVHVEGTAKEEDFIAAVTSRALLPFIKYHRRNTKIEFSSGLVIGAKLNRAALVVTTVEPFLPLVSEEPASVLLPLSCDIISC